VISSAIAITLLNPKLTIFFFAFLPQFVDPGAPHVLLRMLGLSAVVMVATLVVFGAYGVCAASVRERLIQRPRVMVWLRRTCAASFVALSAKLALTDR